MTSNSADEARMNSESIDRKLRYRALLANLLNLDDETSHDERIAQTTNVLQEAQALMAEGDIEGRVRHPGEGYLDSKVLRSTSDQVVKCSLLISGNVNIYDKHALATHIKENASFWDLKIFPKEVPPAVFLFGTFNPTPPEERPRVTRRRVERQKAAALKRPEDVERVEKTDEGSEMVVRVKKFINKTYRKTNKPLSYFHVTLDPTSFSRTVENIYFISFLVRDGVISVDIDETYGLPFITPRSQSEMQSLEQCEENQFIISLNMKRWRDLVQAFGITEPMMVLKRT